MRRRSNTAIVANPVLIGAATVLVVVVGSCHRKVDSVAVRYRLAGSDIDAVVPAVRIDGHWYLADFIRRAEASLAATDAAKPASP